MQGNWTANDSQKNLRLFCIRFCRGSENRSEQLTQERRDKLLTIPRRFTSETFSQNLDEGFSMKSFSVRMLVLALVTSFSGLLSAEDKAKDIVDTAVAAGSFKTLAAALTAADLVDTLKGKGPFTVFAPTDEAFAKLPKETLESLLKPENKKKLASILTYHVVPGKVLAKDVVKLSNAKTAQGSSVKIVVKDGKVMVDGANVVKTDIETSNGVIHVIDTVIIPK